ncbi:hypothetical protein B566_EDAN011331 [Ephemera danica]|nr:hypothetical protein B566_EDAN011331 [Ephemera danica]
MPAQNLWRVEIINKDQVGDVWHTIESLVRLVHVNSSQALKFSGRQLADWGFNQHEVVTDRVIAQEDTAWNVEEHRYTTSKSDFFFYVLLHMGCISFYADQKERERDMVQAEMIPTRPTHLSFWDKFWELQSKMLFSSSESLQHHMYSSEPLEWPFMSRGIAYWVSTNSNAQVHLIGNVAVWYAGTAGIVSYCVLLAWYLLRRRRQCFDISEAEWLRFCTIGEVLFVGYVVHIVPYLCMERTLFLHHYLPALMFKILLTAALAEHIYYVASESCWGWLMCWPVRGLLVVWLLTVLAVFRRFLPLSYGSMALSAKELLDLRWQDTWDFIVHRQPAALPVV